MYTPIDVAKPICFTSKAYFHYRLARFAPMDARDCELFTLPDGASTVMKDRQGIYHGRKRLGVNNLVFCNIG